MNFTSNIWKYYFIRIFIKRMIVPVLLVYMLSRGLTAAEVGVIFFIGTVVSFIFEIPSGYLADKLGHKSTIILSLALQALSMLLYAMGSTFTSFTIATIVFWLGNALWSGTGSAFLFETLKELGREDNYEKVEGRATAYSQFISMILLIAVSLIYTYDRQLPFILSAGFFAISALVAVTLAQPRYRKNVAAKGDNIFAQDWQRISSVIKNNKRYTSTMLFFTTWGAIQDALDEFMQLYFQFLRIPTQLFGFIYAANRGLHGVGALYAERYKQRSVPSVMASFGIQLGVFFLLAATIRHYAGVLLFPLRNIMEGVSGPLYEGYIHREITEGDRITLLSVGSFVASTVQALISLLLGLLFTYYTVPTVFLLMGLVTVVILLPLYLYGRRSYTIQ